MKALIVSGDLFEDTELLVPLYRLREEDIAVDIGSITTGAITGKHGYSINVDCSLQEINPSSYDLLILPGGKAPSSLRTHEQLLDIVRHFMAEDKIVAAICHGPQILVSADVLTDRKVTCYKSVAEEVQSAGADYRDTEVVIDGNLITSRIPSDLPAFCREIIRQCKTML